MTYKYHVLGTPYGGEHTIGTIPKKVAEYWLKQGADAFLFSVFVVSSVFQLTVFVEILIETVSFSVFEVFSSFDLTVSMEIFPKTI